MQITQKKKNPILQLRQVKVQIYFDYAENHQIEVDQEKVAVKFIQHRPGKCCDDCKNLENEIMYSSKINNQNTLKQYKFVKDQQYFGRNHGCFLVMEQCELKDLNNSVDKFKVEFFDPKVFKPVFMDMAQGIKTLHDVNMAHNDLRSENFFVNKFDIQQIEERQIKIGDFEFASQNEVSEKKLFELYNLRNLQNCSPELYEYIKVIEANQMASEEKCQFDLKKFDIYGFGVALIQIFLRLQFSDLKNAKNLIKLLENGDEESLKQFMEAYPRCRGINKYLEKFMTKDTIMKVINVISGCLQPYENRLNISQIIEKLQNI